MEFGLSNRVTTRLSKDYSVSEFNDALTTHTVPTPSITLSSRQASGRRRSGPRRNEAYRRRLQTS